MQEIAFSEIRRLHRNDVSILSDRAAGNNPNTVICKVLRPTYKTLQPERTMFSIHKSNYNENKWRGNSMDTR